MWLRRRRTILVGGLVAVLAVAAGVVVIRHLDSRASTTTASGPGVTCAHQLRAEFPCDATVLAGRPRRRRPLLPAGGQRRVRRGPLRPGPDLRPEQPTCSPARRPSRRRRPRTCPASTSTCPGCRSPRSRSTALRRTFARSGQELRITPRSRPPKGAPSPPACGTPARRRPSPASPIVFGSRLRLAVHA